MKETISKEALDVISRFQNLNIGEKKIIAPYYMNTKKERAGLRAMIGKGSPEEIELEVKVWAHAKGINLNKLNEKQIREFMIERGIGIDCSGFVTYILNKELKDRGFGMLWNYLRFKHNDIFSIIKRKLRPVENVGANLMTSEDNTIKINNLNDIRPGDLIRSKGKVKNSHHVAIIIETERDEDTNELKSFKYANSTRYYDDQNGIRIGEVVITDLNGELKDQKFNDEYNGKNYFYDDLMVLYEDNGIRRLKVLA